jgi:hypothetical protein
MGTNYYLIPESCPTCGHEEEARHIGKSSAGWAFALHVYPDEEIHTLDDWKLLWNKPGARIKNEYEDAVPVEHMERIIVDRVWEGQHRRAEVNGAHCIGHGPGSWDYIIGEFC